MPRKLSHIPPDWWDYTTLDSALFNDAAKLTERDLRQLSRPGFKVVMYDTLEDFYLAEALEYIAAWKQATADNPVGICGPIGPTEQLPLVARLVNELGLSLKHAHFWGMDEWYDDKTKKEVPVTHALSFERADRELCFDRIQKKLAMPESNLHFPKAKIADFVKTWHAGVRCAVMQGGQGDIKHWAFNDPLKRTGNTRTPRPLRRNTASSVPASSSCTPSPSARTPAPPVAATSPWSRRWPSPSAPRRRGSPTRSRSGTPALTTTRWANA